MLWLVKEGTCTHCSLQLQECIWSRSLVVLQHWYALVRLSNGVNFPTVVHKYNPILKIEMLNQKYLLSHPFSVIPLLNACFGLVVNVGLIAVSIAGAVLLWGAQCQSQAGALFNLVTPIVIVNFLVPAIELVAMSTWILTGAVSFFAFYFGYVFRMP